MEQSTKLQVIYIVGYERSGTTIFSKLLGQAASTAAVGEPALLWPRALKSTCGCGEKVTQCEFWSAVLERAGSHGIGEDYFRRAEQATANRRLKTVLLPGGAERLRRRLRPLAAEATQLYRAIAEVSGKRVIIDASKRPAYAALLEQADELDVHVVHLIRDPRGVLYSLIRRRDAGHPYYSKELSVPRSILVWNVMNAAAQRLWQNHPDRYTAIRYEDFVARPKEVLASVLNRAGVSANEAPHIENNRANVVPTHSLLGDHRFDVGEVVLREDTAWVGQLQGSTQRWMRVLAWPSLTRYGYV